MSIVDSDYRAPHWLRNPHVQSMLASSNARVQRGLRALQATGATRTEHVLEVEDGVRLLGIHSHVPGRAPRALAVLLHGWEGSAESGYMRLSAARLLDAGADVFRLNFRDHGPTHHLNEGLFHSVRLDEVLQAVAAARARWPHGPLLLGGWSLGGNFALRVALHASRIGLEVARVAAVCPALDPDRTTQAMETGFPLYRRYFLHKWTRSLKRKRALHPQAHDFDDGMLRGGLRELTERLILRNTPFASVDAYFDAYRISADRLRQLRVPADILTAADDPVIPVADFHVLQQPPGMRIEIAAHGGHCGFLRGAALDGYGEDWMARRLMIALEHDARHTAPIRTGERA